MFLCKLLCLYQSAFGAPSPAMGGCLSPIDPSGCNIHLPHLDGPNSSRSTPPLNGGGGGQRTKRMRTSFKHHQLRTMKSYFAINQNPDAKDLKQLAAKTSLSKRVLQVCNGDDPLPSLNTLVNSLV
ncbi:UNVERIFIED_CONTAM: ttx-3 [Trichonephila clavipes]